jgi:predicted Zn-dependent protease
MKTEKTDIQALLDQILQQVDAPDAVLSYKYENNIATRFADNAITQNLAGENQTVHLQVAYGNQHGSSSTNQVDDASITALIKAAEDSAKLAPEDPEYVEPVEHQTYPNLPDKFDPKQLSIDPLTIADSIQTATDVAKQNQLISGGIFENGYTVSALANTKGVFAYHKTGVCDFSLTMHGENGSGYGATSGYSMKKIDPHYTITQAKENALSAQNPRSIEPGKYTVIFEPQAVMDLLMYLMFVLDARQADEGASPFTNQVGNQLFSDRVSLRFDVEDPDFDIPCYGQDGLSNKSFSIVEQGKLLQLVYDRYWAKKTGNAPTPAAVPFVMDGESDTLSSLIKQCSKGLLVKRLWYIRFVDYKSLLLTGMTRDGVFLVENGQIKHPVKNMRFNDSPIHFLKNLVGMTSPVRVGNLGKVPGIMSEEFTFTSITESV